MQRITCFLKDLGDISLFWVTNKAQFINSGRQWLAPFSWLQLRLVDNSLALLPTERQNSVSVTEIHPYNLLEPIAIIHSREFLSIIYVISNVTIPFSDKKETHSRATQLSDSCVKGTFYWDKDICSASGSLYKFILDGIRWAIKHYF